MWVGPTDAFGILQLCYLHSRAYWSVCAETRDITGDLEIFSLTLCQLRYRGSGAPTSGHLNFPNIEGIIEAETETERETETETEAEAETETETETEKKTETETETETETDTDADLELQLKTRISLRSLGRQPSGLVRDTSQKPSACI